MFVCDNIKVVIDFVTFEKFNLFDFKRNQSSRKLINKIECNGSRLTSEKITNNAKYSEHRC